MAAIILVAVPVTHLTIRLIDNQARFREYGSACYRLTSNAVSARLFEQAGMIRYANGFAAR